MILSNTYAEIDLDAILANYRQCVAAAAGAQVMAVIKADAYGHGAVAVGKALGSECSFFGVSSVAEALELRAAGLTQPILILGHTDPACFDHLIQNDVRPTIFCEADAKALSDRAAALGREALFHIAVDTGMSRIGLEPTEESADLCLQLSRLPMVKIEGVFSHYACADMADLTVTHRQTEQFRHFQDLLCSRGLDIPLYHMGNSAATMLPGHRFNMVRCGIVLYGLYPSDEVDKTRLSLTPAMSWYSRVTHVKTLEPGRAISYGGTFVTEAPTRVATVAAGYADGYRRSLSNRFYVLIRGQKAPILGRVCMDQFMVDVTHIPHVVPGDKVTLMGRDGDETITAEALAQAAGSFNYEQVCDLSRRVSRIYRQGGHINYLTD